MKIKEIIDIITFACNEEKSSNILVKDSECPLRYAIYNDSDIGGFIAFDTMGFYKFHKCEISEINGVLYFKMIYNDYVQGIIGSDEFNNFEIGL